MDVPPAKLRQFTDILVENPSKILDYIFLESQKSRRSGYTPEMFRSWNRILDNARELELSLMPSREKYLAAGASGVLSAAGLACALAVPITTPIAIASLVVALGSGSFSIWQSGNTINDSMTIKLRLNAIDDARRILRRFAERVL